MQSKTVPLGKINETDKFQPDFTRKKREDIVNISDERRDITTDPIVEIMKGVVWKNLVNKVGKLDEMNTFLERHHLSKLTKENQKSPMSTKEVGFVIKSHSV